MKFALLSLALGLPGPAAASLDKDSLLRILEAASAPSEDLTCEYEGSMSFPQAKDDEFGPGGHYEDYTGLFVLRRDGAVLIDIYRQYYDGKPMYRETLAMIDGKSEIYGRTVDRPDGAGEVGTAYPPQLLIRIGSLGRVVCLAILIEYLQNDS